MKLLLLIMIYLSSHAVTLSQDAQNGKDIYMEANCQKCHGIDEQYDAKKYDVTNHFKLKKWVSSCMTYFGHSWFPQEQENVLKYLNEIKYKLDISKE